MSIPQPSERPLDGTEKAVLREALGEPSPERIRIALDEVERQVATEDLIILMVDAATQTARAFFDILVETAPTISDFAKPQDKEIHDE